MFAEQVLGLTSLLRYWGFDLGRVELHKFGQIELWLLENLNLADEDVLKWEDLRALLGDLLSHLVGETKAK